jgi:hypothetical protein
MAERAIMIKNEIDKIIKAIDQVKKSLSLSVYQKERIINAVDQKLNSDSN